VVTSLLRVLRDERGFLGIKLKRLFRNPFGKHSLFGRATQIASVLPIPGAGLIGKAYNLMNRAKRGYDTLQGRFGPVLTAAGARGFVPGAAPVGVMPGGARVGAPRKRRAATTRRAARSRAQPRRQNQARRQKRKLKFGSPAWRAKYMRRR